MEWLNVNSGALTAIGSIIAALATVALVGITGWYVWLTDKLKATYKPEIVVSVDYFPERNSRYSMKMSVKNIGAGVARKVRFGGDLSFGLSDIPFGEIDFLKDGIDTLVPEGGFSFSQSGSIEPSDDFNKQKLTPVVITVTYEDSVNNKYTDKFPFDFSERIHPSVLSK
jgi:hypothetical protein